MLVSGDQTFLKNINRWALIQLVRSSGGLSRADLAKGTGLTKSTVGLLTADLIAEGWLREGEVVVNVTGRPSTPLFINDDRLLMIGMELGGDSWSVLAVTPTGRVLERRRVQLDHEEARRNLTPDAVVGEMARALEGILERQLGERRLIGVGLGVGGLVQRHTGVLSMSPHWPWRDAPLRELFSAHLVRLGLPGWRFVIMNDANAAVMGEYLFHPLPETGPLLYLTLGIGVGGGILIRDEPLWGQRGFAGEVGHLTLDPDGPACACGNRGCAEMLIGQAAIARELGLPHANAGELLDRLASGDARTRQAVQNAGRWLGVLLGNLVNIFNPSRVVAGGPLTELGEVFLGPAREELARRALPQSLETTTFCPSTSGRDAGARGAAAAVMHEVFKGALSG